MSKTNLPPRVFLQTFSGSLANKALFQERMRGKRTAVFTNHWNHRLSLKTLKRNPQNSLQNQIMADSFFCTYPLHSPKLLFFSIFQCFQISITKPVRVCNHVHYHNFSLTKNFFFFFFFFLFFFLSITTFDVKSHCLLESNEFSFVFWFWIAQPLVSRVNSISWIKPKFVEILFIVGSFGFLNRFSNG